MLQSLGATTTESVCPETRGSQEKPLQSETCPPQLAKKKTPHSNEDPEQPKIKKKKNKFTPPSEETYILR